MLWFSLQERAAQARITDLENQLNRATANAASMKRAKDEVNIYSLNSTQPRENERRFLGLGLHQSDQAQKNIMQAMKKNPGDDYP